MTGLSTKENENEDYEKKLIEEAKDSGISVNEKGNVEPTLLRKQVDHAQIDYTTSSSVINGNVLNNFTKSENMIFFFFSVRCHPFKTSTRRESWGGGGLKKQARRAHGCGWLKGNGWVKIDICGSLYTEKIVRIYMNLT